ncbi:hypothetical protein AB0958_12565 [Streptomyces sp. NPDC006655]|uniref:hypothetical protein n=1 Tax=Streptomyces sp. NPDC006655 TaxID=3156898 RepID=UPI0034537955
MPKLVRVWKSTRCTRSDRRPTRRLRLCSAARSTISNCTSATTASPAGSGPWICWPHGPEIHADVRRCLAAARALLGGDGEAYGEAIVERHPLLVGSFRVDIVNRSLRSGR